MPNPTWKWRKVQTNIIPNFTLDYISNSCITSSKIKMKDFLLEMKICRKAKRTYRNSPEGNGIVLQRVFEVSHHVLSNKTVKRFNKVQTKIQKCKKSQYEPVMHMKLHYLNTMRSYSVCTQLNLWHFLFSLTKQKIT